MGSIRIECLPYPSHVLTLAVAYVTFLILSIANS